MFQWGPLIVPQLDPDWLTDDMEYQFLDLEREVIDLDSDDEAINGPKDLVIVSVDSD